jgi:Transcriptional regulator containing an amidase domain and an AraC-type DNA-binding HTH domain
LQQQFRTHLGVTPQAHYLALRLSQAERLVRDTQLPLQEIALEHRLRLSGQLCAGLQDAVPDVGKPNATADRQARLADFFKNRPEFRNSARMSDARQNRLLRHIAAPERGATSEERGRTQAVTRENCSERREGVLSASPARNQGRRPPRIMPEACLRHDGPSPGTAIWLLLCLTDG